MQVARIRTPLTLSAALLIGLAAVPGWAGEWAIEEVDGASTIGDPVIMFDADGGVAGSTGCNRFMTQGVMQGGSLQITGPVATTRMACPGDGLAQQEQAIVSFFEGEIGVAYDPFVDRMTLTRGDAALVLAAVASVQAEPDMPDYPAPHLGRDIPQGDPAYLAVFGVSGELNIRSAPSTDADVVGGVLAGTVLRNAGCETHDGARWCNVEVPATGLSGWASGEYLEPADSALRAGQGIFDAGGPMPCAMGDGAPMTSCGFGVARDGAGSATVVVTRPDGMTRALFFEAGEFLGTDASQAGGGFDASATREGDLTTVRIDDERYEVPDAVIFGG